MRKRRPPTKPVHKPPRRYQEAAKRWNEAHPLPELTSDQRAVVLALFRKFR